MIKIGLIAAAWIGIGVLNFGGTNADFRDSFPSLVGDRKWTRSNCGNAGFMAMGGPLAFPAVFFGTGFFASGLSYDCSPKAPTKG